MNCPAVHDIHNTRRIEVKNISSWRMQRIVLSKSLKQKFIFLPLWGSRVVHRVVLGYPLASLLTVLIEENGHPGSRNSTNDCLNYWMLVSTHGTQGTNLLRQGYQSLHSWIKSVLKSCCKNHLHLVEYIESGKVLHAAGSFGSLPAWLGERKQAPAPILTWARPFSPYSHPRLCTRRQLSSSRPILTSFSPKIVHTPSTQTGAFSPHLPVNTSAIPFSPKICERKSTQIPPFCLRPQSISLASICSPNLLLLQLKRFP